MSRLNIVLVAAVVWAGGTQAEGLDAALAPGQNFDLSSYVLQTLDEHLQFREVSPIGAYQDAYFFTDRASGAMRFRVPSGAGHSKDSEFPRVELRESASWRIGARDGARHVETVVLRVMAEPASGELIFAQIHGEKVGGSEALKMRWSHGAVSMGVKKHYGDAEQRIALLGGLAPGDVIECRLELVGEKLRVSVHSGDSAATRDFSYDAGSWKSIPVYFKAGNYSQDKDADGSVGVVAVERLELGR